MDWTVTIKGSGSVHDVAAVDKQVDAFVAALKDSGANVTSATFTHEPLPEPVSVDKLSQQVQAP